MADKNLINTFENISKFDNFSKYNCILDHEFKDKSLKSFIISLKHYKTKDKENFIEEFYKKYPYQFEEKKIIEDADEVFEHIRGSKNKITTEKEIQSNNNKQTKLNYERKKIIENEIPDSLRYNPNYNSIFKKIPGFKMGNKLDLKNLKIKKNLKTNFTNSNKAKLYKNSPKDKNKQEVENNLFKTNIKININDKNDKNNNMNKNDMFLNLPPISFRNVNNNSKNDNDLGKKYNTIEVKSKINDNISKSKKYQQRNFNFELENNKNKSEFTYSKINNNIDFGKMSSRNDKYLINAYSLDVPSSEKYSPKYSFVETNVKNINFSPFGSNKNRKKFLFKKMLGSYNVPTEYQFIDNEKLLNNKELINQQLILRYNNFSSK